MMHITIDNIHYVVYIIYDITYISWTQASIMLGDEALI